jgi:beta-glucanase (GH16 family)
MHWDNNGHVQYGGATLCNVTQYHVYSVEWDANSIQWLLDGNKYCEGNIANNINSTDEFHLPFFIILNFAVGGNWPGNPDNTTQFPDTMYVDYIRVSQKVVSSASDGSEHIPDHYALLQNYPNPFNPSTSVSFSLPTISFVSLKIFDLIGREVTTLVSQEMSAGNHSQEWNATGFPSGVYIYQLRAGSFVASKKLVLLK